MLSNTADHACSLSSSLSPSFASVAGFTQTSPLSVNDNNEDFAAVDADAVDPRHALGSFQAAVALFKAIVGPSILFLPSAVKNAGLISSSCVGCIMGAVTMVYVVDARLFCNTAEGGPQGDKHRRCGTGCFRDLRPPFS